MSKIDEAIREIVEGESTKSKTDATLGEINYGNK